MLRTPLCDLLGIAAPVICAPFGPWEEVELATLPANPAYRPAPRLPGAGQSAGLIRDIAPAAVILERLLTEADAALRTAGAARTPA